MFKDVLIVSSIDFSLQQLKMLDLVKLYFLSAEEQPLTTNTIFIKFSSEE